MRGPLAIAVTCLVLTRAARAEGADDWNLGLAPPVGGGVALMSGATPYPKQIAYTLLGGELFASKDALGGFLRAAYLSSGNDGRWTAATFSLGPTWRLFGDGYDRTALVVRGGLAYERWFANGTCSVWLFLPSECPYLPAPAARADVSADAFGVLAGARVEMPVHAFYLAWDSELAATTSGQAGGPGTMIELRLSLVLAFQARPSARFRGGGPKRPRRWDSGT